MKKHTCEICGIEVWKGQDICQDCELAIKEKRFDEKEEVGYE